MREVVRGSGVTSRTLRHYDQVGLLSPSSVGVGGERRYNDDALVRLQRILVLRGLGLGLPAIERVLSADVPELDALREHADQLRQERQRLETRLVAVEHTIAARSSGGKLAMEEMFKGYDHKQYEQEVEQRWGAEAARSSAQWWDGLSEDARRDWQGRAAELGQAWTDAAASDADPRGPVGLELAARHVTWLRSVPGTPAVAANEEQLRAYVLGLADMYVADPRFAENYGGETSAAWVRSALRAHFGLDG